MRINKNSIALSGIVALTLMLMPSCVETTNVDENNGIESEMDEITENLEFIDSKRALLVESIIRSSPTIAESGQIFAEIGTDFDRTFLNDIKNITNYVTIKDQGINLGIYLSDLGYITAFDQTQEIIFYMNCSKKMAEGIGVSDVFNEETIERMEMNINDKDSIINLIAEMYWKTDAFLKELGRENISAMIICGAWVEGMYIGTQLMDDNADSDILYEKMISQKENLDKILSLLETFEGDEKILFYKEKLNEIQTHFNNIESENTEEVTEDQKAELKLLAQKIEVLRQEMTTV